MDAKLKDTIDVWVKRLSDYRCNHTLAVTRLSGELASHYGVDAELAWMASMLHDITKEHNLSEQLQIIEQSDIIIDSDLSNCSNLLHSTTAFIIARDVVGVENVDVLNAVRYHTSGRADMSMLEKIVYVADACAYDRTYAQAACIRKLSFEDIDKAMLEIIEFTLLKCLKRRRYIGSGTIKCYNCLVEQGKDCTE